jgi:hypothetical protein
MRHRIGHAPQGGTVSVTYPSDDSGNAAHRRSLSFANIRFPVTVKRYAAYSPLGGKAAGPA